MKFVQTAREYKKGQRLKVIEISIQLKAKPLAQVPGQQRVTPIYRETEAPKIPPKFTAPKTLTLFWKENIDIL